MYIVATKCKCLYVNVLLNTYSCIRVRICTCKCKCISINMYKHMNKYMYKYMNNILYNYMYKCMYIYMYRYNICINIRMCNYCILKYITQIMNYIIYHKCTRSPHHLVVVYMPLVYAFFFCLCASSHLFKTLITLPAD